MSNIKSTETVSGIIRNVESYDDYYQISFDVTEGSGPVRRRFNVTKDKLKKKFNSLSGLAGDSLCLFIGQEAPVSGRVQDAHIDGVSILKKSALR
jgi:hypothetical protein